MQLAKLDVKLDELELDQIPFLAPEFEGRVFFRDIFGAMAKG